MRISEEKVRKFCSEKGLRLKELLHRAGVSKTAYYSLVRKDAVLPRSIMNMARYLGVSAAEFLDDDTARLREAIRLNQTVAQICREYPECDPDNIRHTLLVLKEKPWDRMGRGLIRARKSESF